MNPRFKKFLSYYKPYRHLLAADVACAFVVSLTTLLLPLCASYITKNLLDGSVPDPLPHIYGMGAVMILLVIIYNACNAFVDYRGHMMGAVMEGDMRAEL